MDLTNDIFLDLVEEFWKEHGMDSGLRRNSKSGVALIEHEIWLKDIGLSSNGSRMMLEMWWVDHVARTMVLASQEINDGGSTVQEDREFRLLLVTPFVGVQRLAVLVFDSYVLSFFKEIDMEHRYWAFIQSHPAHTVLPPNAKSAAINTLAWAWTGTLLLYPYSHFYHLGCRSSFVLASSRLHSLYSRGMSRFNDTS